MTLDKARAELEKLEADLLARVERFTKLTGIEVNARVYLVATQDERTSRGMGELGLYEPSVDIVTL